MLNSRIIKLSAEPTPKRIRLLSSFELADSAEVGQAKWVTVTRTGTFTDPRYGSFEITRAMLLSMVKNFQANVFGQEISIDVNHKPENGAAATIKELAVEGDRLRAKVVFTKYGIEAVKERGFRYLSAEYHENFVDNEGGRAHGPTLLGAGLTVRPVIKRLDPVQLSESATDCPTLIHPTLIKKLAQEGANIMAQWLKDLVKKLSEMGLPEATVQTLMLAAQTAAEGQGDDDAALKKLSDSFVAAGAEIKKTSGTVQLSVTAPGVDMAKVGAEVTRILAERDTAAKKLAETADANVQSYRKTLAEAKFDDTAIKALSEYEGMIDANTTPDQLARIVALATKAGNDAAVTAQLRQLGMGSPMGSPRISIDESNVVKKLSADIRTGLLQHQHTHKLQLAESDKLNPFVQKYLAEFDRIHAPQLHNEAKRLAATTVDTANMTLPVSFQRVVIQEAYQDLLVLDLVETAFDTSQSYVHQIPYETRNVPASMLGDGLVFEGQPIPSAGVKQEMDYAYINAVKLRMMISNEAAHFSSFALINWDAAGRNIASNARYMRELAAYSIANEMQRAADLYGAVPVASETHTAQVNGTRNQFKTTNFPIVRPLIERDLKGTQIGTTVAPIAVTLNSVSLSEYNGTGTQAAGNYWRITDYNLGYYQIVNQAGVVQTPANTTPLVIGYSYATNVQKVDIDVPSGVDADLHYNKIVEAFGDRKAMMADDRFVAPNFSLMSNTVNNLATKARAFVNEGKRADVSMSASGNLEMIKSIPAFATNAPGIHLGDSRILLGQRGTTKYTISKPYQLGQPFEVVDSSGIPTGQKQAYGEEYRSMKTPLPLRSRYTSVILYSATARTAV